VAVSECGPGVVTSPEECNAAAGALGWADQTGPHCANRESRPPALPVSARRPGLVALFGDVRLGPTLRVSEAIEAFTHFPTSPIRFPKLSTTGAFVALYPTRDETKHVSSSRRSSKEEGASGE
jgi:hypothetical protein